MKVLLSIKPEYAEKILNGTKHYEFRKTIFRESSIKTIVIYATKPLGKIVGEFEISYILEEEPKKLWSITREHAGIPEDFFMDYFKNRSKGFAIKVGEAKRYKKPKDLYDIIGSKVAPQSFCYF